MADPSVGWEEIAKGAWGVVISVLGYLGLTTRNDVADLKRDYVRRDDHDRTVLRIEAAMKEHRDENRENNNRVLERLDSISDRLPPEHQ